MSSSDQLTSAYVSKESSTKTLSTTFADGPNNGSGQSPTNGDVATNLSRNENISAEEHHLLSRATTAAPMSVMPDGTSEEDHFLDTGVLVSPATEVNATPVVLRQGVSIADISQMRLEGCRTHQLTPSSSCHGSVCEAVPSAWAAGASPHRTSRSSSRAADVQDAPVAVSPSSTGGGRSLQAHSCSTSPRTTALDTSVAILQHMAVDTAARVEAARGGQTPAELLLMEAPSNTSTPPVLQAQQFAVGPAVVEHVAMEYAIDPVGFTCDPDSDLPVSQLHTCSMKPHQRSLASSNSPLHSLSESELYGGQVRPLGVSRNIPAQALSQPVELAGDTTAAIAATTSTSALRVGESPDGTHRRLPLVAMTPHALRAERSPSEAASPLSGLPDPTAAAAMGDASVYNHDFQRIISHEVKEALTRNMRPIVDDDEDEDEVLLNDVLSGQASPALPPTPKQKRSFAHTGESRSCTFAPFQLPMGATSISRLDSVVGVSNQKSGGTVNDFAERTTFRQPLSPATAALEGEASGVAALAAQVSSGAVTSAATSTATSTTASRGGKAGSPRAVASHAWRFPTLGKDADEADDMALNVTAMTTKACGAATSSPQNTHRTTLPNSCNGNGNHQPEQMTPLSWSWRQHRGGDGSNAISGRPRSTNGQDPGVDVVAATTAVAAATSAVAGTKGGNVPSTSAVAADDTEVGAGKSVGGGAGAVGAVRFEDGRLYTQPPLSTHSLTSLTNNGGVPEDSYPRKLEMVYTVYERLSQQRCNAPTATPKAVKEFVAAKSARSAPENLPVTPHTYQLPSSPPQRSPGVTATTNTMPSSGVSSRARRSPSLSCSGALGRSAGYYSFGTRMSLSHPNRQALPQQYLGSCSTLMHSTPSPRTAVLGSPAVLDLVVGSTNSAAGGVGATANPSVSESPLTHATSSATRMARRSLNSVLVRRIESRPLLQSTLFLKHTLRAIRETHAQQVCPLDTSKDSNTMSQLALSANTAVPSYQHELSRFANSFSGDAAAQTVGNERQASMATPLGSLANVASEDAELSSGQTRGPASASSRSSFADKALQSTSTKMSATRGPEQFHTDPNNSRANSNGHAYAAALVQTPVEVQSQPETAQRYYRALTEAGQRVRHVHGVDGVEREVDNEALDLIVYVGMRLMGWLEVVSLLGCGSFGQVFLCKDLRICDGHFVHPSEIGGVDYEYWNCSHAFLPFSSVDIPPTNPPLVAVKVVKSVPLLEQQSVLEAEMLVLIGAQTAVPAGAAEYGNAPPPEDPRCANVAKVLADGICYGHHCIVMERYGANLYEYIASNGHLGLPMYQIRSIGHQLFTALSLIHDECHIIHADIKPENMLLTLNSSRGVVRTNEAPTATTAAAPSKAAATARSPDTTPPLCLPRTEEPVANSTTCSPERSYITLRTGPTAAGRHRHGQPPSRRSSGVPLDASISATSKLKGQSFCHLRSSVTSRVTVVEQTNVPAPEPRRVQSLNQSAGMLPSRAVPAAQPDAPSLAAAAGSSAAAASAGGGKSAAASPSSMIPRLHVKLIDFSSSCYDGGPFYQYIQSRYYRAPEVIVGATYGSGIDIWSSGCLLAELLLGMPLLPGCNDHHQLCLIEEMVGALPTSVVQEGANAELYYRRLRPGETAPKAAKSTPQTAATAAASTHTPLPRPYALRSREEFLAITQSEPQPYRRYFTYQTLQELVRHCPLTLEERRMGNGLQPYVPANESSEIPPNATPSPSVRSEMMKQRFLLFDLLRRLLQTDPKLRPTASQVLTHPFFTSAPPYTKTFKLE